MYMKKIWKKCFRQKNQLFLLLLLPVVSHSIMTDVTNRKHLFKSSFFFNQLVLILKQDLTVLFNVIQ
jgi:hypothetical protein